MPLELAKYFSKCDLLHYLLLWRLVRSTDSCSVRRTEMRPGICVQAFVFYKDSVISSNEYKAQEWALNLKCFQQEMVLSPHPRLRFIYLCVLVCACVSLRVPRAGRCPRRSEGFRCPEQELQTVVRHLMWVLEAEHGYSARAVSVLNRWTSL